MISRHLLQSLDKRRTDKKALIILGPRQSGKTTLTKQIQPRMQQPVLWWNGDEADVRSRLENATSTKLRSLIGKHKTLIIDEAQRIANIGIIIKLITDNLTGVKVIATGSSAFELANKINEPLTGRKWEFHLYPLSFGEMVEYHGQMEEMRMLDHRLVYGYYPEVVKQQGDEKELLNELASNYLYKDILTWENIQKPDKLEKLVQALSFQVGNEVSYHELGLMCGLNNETVEKYISLLEKAFIVFRLGSLSRNLRNEIKKSRKIYFYDNGIRNAVIHQFNPVNLRNDIGALWENFIISERMKYLEYQRIFANKYFWRTHAQQEIDYVEEKDGHLCAYEIKWRKKSTYKFPKSFIEAYPGGEYKIITPENFHEWL
jgi:predicted AAA+ superfamily ATPase